MRVTFAEMGLDMAQYNGMPWGVARAYIINETCDYIMMWMYQGHNENDVLRRVTEGHVDVTCGHVLAHVNPSALTNITYH